MTWISALLFPALLGVSLGGEIRAAEQDPDQDQRPRFRPMPTPQAVVKRRTLRIAVDGALDDWPSVVPLILYDPRQVSGTAMGAYHGTSDVSGQAYMLWDEENLYLAVQVVDEWHRGLPKETPLVQEIPPVDNVVITFDPGRDTRSLGADSGRGEDRAFFLADLERLGDTMLMVDEYRGVRNRAFGAKVRVDRRDTEGVTIYEARIPWREILPPGQTPEPKRILDLQLVINDHDDVTDPVPQTRVGWTFGMGPEVLPAVWGSIMLVDDYDPSQDREPVFAPPPDVESSVPGRRYWIDLYRKIRSQRPVFVTHAIGDPAHAGGAERYKLLTELERHYEGMPRFDNLNYLYRVQRRMLREVGGIGGAGLPYFWDQTFTELTRAVVAPPEQGSIRVFRLPQGGWYVRSETVNFLIDPVGNGIERLFNQGGVDFALMTRPNEITRRHDPLLIRMSAANPQRPFFTHLAFHLPGAVPGSMDPVVPGKDYRIGGLKRILPIGAPVQGGKVQASIGYLVEWEDGRTLMAAGLGLTKELIEEFDLHPDILIVSGQHHQAADFARLLRAEWTLLDDVFVAEVYPDSFGGRLSYGDALKVQSLIKPRASLILAPGEWIDLKK